MKNFMKYFNEFGTKEYNLTDSIIINIYTNKDKNIDNNEKIIDMKDKGIIIIFNPKSMLEKYNAYVMHVITYDSPIMPIKTTGKKKDSTLDTFISITLYDRKGNEIKIDDLEENIRPKILYDKNVHKNLRHCFYYDEKNEDLDKKNVKAEDNYSYKGNKYFKCSSKHLTSFTVGDYNKKISTLEIMLIILGVILFLGILVMIYIYIRKKMKKNSIETSVNDKNLGVLSTSD